MKDAPVCKDCGRDISLVALPMNHSQPMVCWAGRAFTGQLLFGWKKVFRDEHQQSDDTGCGGRDHGYKDRIVKLKPLEVVALNQQDITHQAQPRGREPENMGRIFLSFFDVLSDTSNQDFLSLMVQVVLVLVGRFLIWIRGDITEVVSDGISERVMVARDRHSRLDSWGRVGFV